MTFSATATVAPSLKNTTLLGPRVLQSAKFFHAGQPCLALIPPLSEYDGKDCHGLIPEESFQFLYPKTDVMGSYVLRTGLILYFLSKAIYVRPSLTYQQ